MQCLVNLGLLFSRHTAFTEVNPLQEFAFGAIFQFAFSPAWIMKSAPEDPLYIAVNHNKLLLKLLPPMYKVSRLIEDHAFAIEHQLILPPHQIVEGHDGDVIRRPGGKHPLSKIALTRMVGG